MAENKNDLDYQNEAYHDVEESKSVFQAFKNFFNRQKALPESSESKHKTSYISMSTSMGLREFRSNLVEKIGNFFSSLSKIGAPKKEENLNKFAKEVVGTQTKEVSAEKTRNDDETLVSQEAIYFPGDISIKQNTKTPSPETIIIAETDFENEFDESSIDTGTIDVDDDFEKDNDRIEAADITVANQPDLNKINNQPQKNIIIPKAPGKQGKIKDDDSNIR